MNNIASIQTSNGDSLLVKGKFIKAKNQWFNKNIAKNMRGQTIGTTNKSKSSKALNNLYKNRKLFMEDVMHKISKKIIEWCRVKNVSTIVICNCCQNCNFLSLPDIKNNKLVKK